MSNLMAKLVNRFNRLLPPKAAAWGATLLFNSQVKFSGTARQKFLELDASKSVVKITNRRRVQNHIGGVHAAGMALAAETATGAVFNMNVPKGSLPLLKSMKVEYVRRAVGDITATATLDAAQRNEIASSPRGSITVPVVVKDAAGNEPCTAEMVWAWTTGGGKGKPKAKTADADPAAAAAAAEVEKSKVV